jgi:hypothetical protein
MGGVNAAQNAVPTSESAGPSSLAGRSGSRAAVILGNDAVVAARPSSPAQLARACVSAGFDIVVPPSWGDELVAEGYLAQLATHREAVVVACGCARVATLLARSTAGHKAGRETIAAPPVAAARYLRLVYGDALLVTFVGDCPGASDPCIDARFTPSGFFASLHRQGVTLGTGSDDAEFTDAEADRWRRHRSMPGGLPARRFLARPPVERVLREVDTATFDSAGWQPSRSRVLLDLAESARCSCTGNRAQVEDQEPARSTTPILVPPPGLDLRPELSPRRPRVSHSIPAGPSASPSARDHARNLGTTPPCGAADEAASQAASASSAPAATAATAVTHDAIPPAVTVPSQPSATSREARSPVVVAAPARTPATPTGPTTAVSAVRRRHATTLAMIPVIVLAISAALGALTYVAVAGDARNGAGSERRERSALTGETAAHTDSLDRKPSLAPRAPGIDSSGTPNAAGVRPATPTPRVDSARTAPGTRPRRRRAPDVVPGWLPQGQKAWTPADTIRSATPDSSGTSGARPDTSPRA